MQASLLLTAMLCFALTTSTLYNNGRDVAIFRAERDIFTNVAHCNEMNAVCFDENCSYCQCMMDQTYIQTRGQYGKCVSNELVVYATANESSFLVESNYQTNFCIYRKLYSNGFTFVQTERCDENNWNYRWIWTNYGQLLNWETLECATNDFYSSDGNYYVIMKKCDRSNHKQLWKCAGEKKYGVQSTTGQYIFHNGQYITMVFVQSQKTEWKRFGSENDVCSQAVTECDKFEDGSSLVILNKTKCEEELECLGEKAISLKKTTCFLLQNTTQYLHNETWQSLEIKNGSLGIASTTNKVHLKWNLKRTPEYWEGLMIKVQFTCINAATKSGKSGHCVVIKYTGTFTGFYDDGEDAGDDDEDDGKDNAGDGDEDDKDTDEDDKDIDGNKDGDKDGDKGGGDNKGKTDTNNDKEYNAEDKKNNQTIIIIVCVLVVLILAGIVMFVIYRYRHRCVRPTSKKAEDNVADSTPKEEYADALNPLYPANNNLMAQRECELYEPTPDHVYQYVDVDHRTADPPPQNLTYDYAVADGPINHNIPSKTELDVIEMEAAPESSDEKLIGDGEGETTEEIEKDLDPSTKPPPHKYHVLEGP